MIIISILSSEIFLILIYLVIFLNKFKAIPARFCISII